MSNDDTKGGFRKWFADRVPVPMAAPESPDLKKARVRIMLALTMLAVVCLSWGWIGGVAGGLAIGVFVGLIVFLALQIPAWLIAKSKADDAWLMRGSEEDA